MPRPRRRHLDDVINQLLKDGVSPELVEAAKRAEIAQAEFSKNSAVTLASAWSQALAWQGLNSPEEAEQQIRNVTVDDVNRVARQYLTQNNRVTIVLTPDNNGKRPPDSAGFGGSESFAGDDKLDAPLPVWAAQALSKLEVPHWTLAPVQMTLSNGIHLIVQPENISKTVTVVGHIDNNPKLQEPMGQEGASRLLASLFDYGTTTLDRDAFHKALDDISANQTGGPDFSIAVLSKDFDRGVQLLADNELHPALPQEAFAVQQNTLARSLAGEMQSPQYKMLKALRTGLLPAGDPELRLPTPETVGKLNLQNVKDYYAGAYRPDLTTIVVVGDIAPEQAKATFEHYFGGWKSNGAKPQVISQPVVVNPAGLYGDRKQLRLAGSGTDGTNAGSEHLQPRSLRAASGQRRAGRQWVRVATDGGISVCAHGYAYGASSGVQFDRSRSTFFVQYGSDAEKVGPGGRTGAQESGRYAEHAIEGERTGERTPVRNPLDSGRSVQHRFDCQVAAWLELARIAAGSTDGRREVLPHTDPGTGAGRV